MAGIKKNCSHPVLIEDMCVKCGQWPVEAEGVVPFFNVVGDKVHKISVSRLKAERIEAVIKQQLIEKRKLSLILDIDNTLVHVMEESDVAAMHEPDYDFEFELSGNNFVGKFREGVHEFLRKAQNYFDIFLYTMGTRNYARTIAPLLHPTLFTEDRIISRDDCPEHARKSIRRLFPCDDSTVLIVDDRADVWTNEFGQVPSNLIKIKPFHFFMNSELRYPNRDVTEAVCKGRDLRSVLRILKAVHSEFFSDKFIYPDVKTILKTVASQGKAKVHTKNLPDYIEVLTNTDAKKKRKFLELEPELSEAARIQKIIKSLA